MRKRSCPWYLVYPIVYPGMVLNYVKFILHDGMSILNILSGSI